MLKIGDFSKLAHVTVKTLRHYARIGLLAPAWTDRFNGYRYYNLAQLSRLNRILALKDLGFSLEQIGELVNEEVSVEQMRGMLKHKQAELEAHLRAEQKRLGMVAARLQQIEAAGIRAGREVLVKSVAALPVAAVHEVVPSIDSLPVQLNALVDELNDWMALSGITPRGPWLALYPAAEYTEKDIPIELAVSIDPAALHRTPEKTTRIRFSTLPAVTEMACLVHTGAGNSLPQAYAELYSWMETNRRKPAGPTRELYLRDASEDGPITQVIEVQLPIEPLSTSNQTVVDLQKEFRMEPKFVTRPAFNVVGLCYQGANQNQEIAAMWGDFNKREDEIDAVANSLAYGVCIMASGLPDGQFEYVAGFEVPDRAPVPDGMVLRRIPAARYAVFPHRGALDGLHATFERIHNEWLPASGLEPIENGMDMEMEVYTDEFKNFAPDSVLYIYVPVK